ncbi:POK9 protein, partial [Anthoscopus minutus]|nr:POK9 protein [Anthoscopus minutus]
MGALQPRLPAPVMIPEHWNLLIIDLKDCFSTIPLHKNDMHRFAFTARESHAIFHQNAKGLKRTYGLSVDEARAIVKAWAVCSNHNQGLG